MKVLKKILNTIWYFPFALGILHFNKIIQWVCITLMKAMWWLVNLYICLQVVQKVLVEVRTIIIVRKFNEHIAKKIILVDWCSLNKDTKFICDTFIWVLPNNLTIEFYRATFNKSNLIAIFLFRSLQHCFRLSWSCKV